MKSEIQNYVGLSFKSVVTVLEDKGDNYLVQDFGNPGVSYEIPKDRFESTYVNCLPVERSGEKCTISPLC